MKTLLTVLTLTTLVAAVATANAQQQGSDEAAGYALRPRNVRPGSQPNNRSSGE